MLRLNFEGHRVEGPLRLLFLGAHADDIEIGCGGTVLEILERRPETRVDWVVCCAQGEREEEARRAAGAFLADAGEVGVHIFGFRDGFFPWEGAGIKERFEDLKDELEPHIVFTHHRMDRHQDHRTVSELTWNTFRDHLILEYEVPKYDGELGQPNLFVPLDEDGAKRKIDLILEHFPSQRTRPWFDRDTFAGLMRLRGVEAGGGIRWAEAFHVRKAVLEAGGFLP